MRLSPNDPEVLYYTQTATAYAHFFDGNYSDALSWAQTAMRRRPDLFIVCAAAASGALAGRGAEAQDAMRLIRQLYPGLRISNLKDQFPFRRLEDFETWRDGLRKAGLPE